MRTLLLSLFMLAATACGSFIFGSGDLFIWNGTGDRYEVEVSGRNSEKLTLSPHSGVRVNDAIAGKSKVVATKSGGGARTYDLELKSGGAVVVNLEKTACFVRTDITGMYQSGKERVRLIQVYDQAEVLAFDAPVPVMPGEPAPAARPRNTDTFQRLYEAPCQLLAKEAELVEFVRKAR